MIVTLCAPGDDDRHVTARSGGYDFYRRYRVAVILERADRAMAACGDSAVWQPPRHFYNRIALYGTWLRIGWFLSWAMSDGAAFGGKCV